MKFGGRGEMPGRVEGVGEARLAHPDHIGNHILIGGKDQAWRTHGDTQGRGAAPGPERFDQAIAGVLVGKGRRRRHVQSPSMIFGTAHPRVVGGRPGPWMSSGQ